MAELTTLARPDAKAAFEVALQDDAMDSWSRMLALSAAIAAEGLISLPAQHAGAEALDSPSVFGRTRPAEPTEAEAAEARGRPSVWGRALPAARAVFRARSR